ncbi:hypothetical protein NLB33_35255 [Mycolicibacterium smegmatis]|uniref:hypothetical protein n=1 Tax=Mycolicibacterium smegmatis TaxID=1772 RepID=UPI0020A61079|nr:hypothetical protein [Mycolicibacterium smegmatis]MCP2628110.1 hypothetical protein [Mycolicibacterium smegmatis]
MTDTDPLAAAQAKWAATRAAREAEAKKTAAEIRARYDELVARPVPLWTGNLAAKPAVVKAAINDLRDMRAGMTIPLTAWRESLEGDLPGHADAIIGLLTDAAFITIDGDTATVSAALPAESWNTLHPKPEPEPTPEPAQPDPEPASPPPPTFTDEERGIIRRALAVPAGAAFAHSAKEQPIRDRLVERGVLEKTAEGRWVYVHSSDSSLSADDLTTVRQFSAAVIKKLTTVGRDSLAGLDSKVGAELALIVKQRLDGVVIAADGNGRWALIGGKPRLTRPEQRERAEQAAKPKPAPTPKTVPDTVTDHEKTNAAIRETALLRTMREMDRKMDALLTAHNVSARKPSTDPRADGLPDVVWRIAVVLQAIGPSLMSTVTAGYLTKSQQALAKRALAVGLVDGVFTEVPGVRKPRIKVVAPPKGRTWDELHADAERVSAAATAKKLASA